MEGLAPLIATQSAKKFSRLSLKERLSGSKNKSRGRWYEATWGKTSRLLSLQILKSILN